MASGRDGFALVYERSNENELSPEIGKAMDMVPGDQTVA